jgi:tetratricopeptide (TPR) repeat protein
MFDFSITNGIDMTLKRFFLFIVFTLKVQLLSFFLVSIALAQPASEQAVLSNQVQQLSQVNDETIDFDTVSSLSEKIISNHHDYSNDILAKVYLLSARVASNQGNINKVFEFALQGLDANSLDKKIKMALLFKLADVYVAKKEYKQLLEVTQEAVRNSEYSPSVKYRLLSLSYRSVAFSMLGKHQEALVDLQQVELRIGKSDLAEHIELLTILALAYHHLGDYQTSLTMQLKILKLRFEMDQKKNIAQTYLYLGYAYFYLQRYDDAYNVFWESKKSALNNGARIHVAHADKWLGIVLISQKQFRAAFEPLEQAIAVYYQHNMLSERIEASVALVKAKLGVNQTTEGYALLLEVVQLLNGKDISLEYTGFYRMVAEMHFSQGGYQLAYRWREKYSQILLYKLNNKKKSFSIVQGLSHLSVGKAPKIEPVEESKRLAVKLAENSELSSSFTGKYQKQRAIIIILSAVACILVLILVGMLWKLRIKKVNLAYEEIEKPSYAMATPLQTKFNYQLVFKKARKFKYPLSVGYLVVENWQELIFHFSRKNIDEVTKDLASVINEHIKDFDYVGLLNEGEYLLLFEHQSSQEANDKLDKLIQAINTRSFATLGDFSIAMKYSVNMADFKDIDPYLFLARIAESVNITQVNPSKAP